MESYIQLERTAALSQLEHALVKSANLEAHIWARVQTLTRTANSPNNDSNSTNQARPNRVNGWSMF